MTFRSRALAIACCCLWAVAASWAAVPAEIFVPVPSGDATPVLRRAIAKASACKGAPVVIRLEAGNYHLYRNTASAHEYHVSNTASAEECPDATKHIGLWLRGLSNVTVDGGGACFVTHGEMSFMVVDECDSIVLKNFSLKAADPTVAEMTVVAAGPRWMDVRPAADSRFDLSGGRLAWVGEGWRFDGGVAQVYYPRRNVTERCPSPLEGLVGARQLAGGGVRLSYRDSVWARAGHVFQMRHAIRNEVCGLIRRSRNVVLDNLQLHFLGNFGIVGQYSENLTYRRLNCEPGRGSGRTCAGFADFVQMSGCRGKVTITDSRFVGAQDDPINIHGTHLKVVGFMGGGRVRLRFMHGQSYGFDAFAEGDEIDFVDVHSLLPLQRARVVGAQRAGDYEVVLSLDRPVSEQVLSADGVAVENVTWTPEVEIRGNYFARTPTRGILVTTRRKVVIADNLFYRLPMSAVLMADDARGWYESGPVADVSVTGNVFVECGSPVISVAPEVDRHAGPVHRNIRIEGNTFVMAGGLAVGARATDGLSFRGNSIYGPCSQSLDSLVATDRCTNVDIGR